MYKYNNNNIDLCKMMKCVYAYIWRIKIITKQK